MIKFNVAHFINSQEIMQKLCHPETATRGRKKAEKSRKSERNEKTWKY